MSRFGSQHRADDNQKRIVGELRKVRGATVVMTGGAGDGFPDLVVGRAVPVSYLVETYGMDGLVPMNFLLEVKNPKNNRLRPKQKKFKRRWHGQVATVTSDIEALATIGVYPHAFNYQRTGADQETQRED